METDLLDSVGEVRPGEGEIKASVPLVVRGVPEEHTTSRAGRQLVRSGGEGVRVTRTPEDPKVVVARRCTKESVVWSGSRRSSGRKAVEQVGGGVEALSPEARGREAWIRRVRTTLFVVRIICSALPF